MTAPNAVRAQFALSVVRLPLRMGPSHRVIALPFGLTDLVGLRSIHEQVGRMSDEQAKQELEAIQKEFSSRHRNLLMRFEEHYELAAQAGKWPDPPTRAHRLLLGAFCTMEYSLEGAALFNPSIVPHPLQDGAPPGCRRFVMSLRATGEGHLSSVVFQTGMLTARGDVLLDKPGSLSSRARLAPDQSYEKRLFRQKLQDMKVDLSAADQILQRLPEHFTFPELQGALAQNSFSNAAETRESILWLARSNYQLQLEPENQISDLIIFPNSDNESRGIEDLRLVRFVDDDGTATYYGTYTAFNGVRVLPMLLETRDFRRIHIHTLNGRCVQNKGMALFPRRINGKYAMCSRIDGHNLYLMYSDHPYFWEEATVLARPRQPWELRLMGNCGSPLETPAGWLLITHGVGPMRRYCIGAMLLDRDDPSRVIGRLREPLLAPTAEEREGYVPNVVYSCGSMIHGDKLFLPYAMSDTATGMATITLQELLDALLDSKEYCG